MIVRDQSDRADTGVEGLPSAAARGLRWVPWTLIAALALSIRLVALDRFSYWLDEMLEVFVIRSSWRRMFQTLLEQRFNPPLDYVLQKAFDTLGPSDAARRILPALWGTGCVIAFGLLVARRADRRVGIVTALCLAFSPFHVHYSQEVRPYALGMFLIALTLLLIDRWMERPGAIRLASVLVCATAVAYTMFLAALVIGIAGGALVLEDAMTGSAPRRKAARWILWWSPALVSIMAVAYLPWLKPVWQLLGAPPFTQPPAFAPKRVVRLFSYFGFGFHDWYPLGRAGVLFMVLAAAGTVLAFAKYRLRFLVVWAVLGAATIELLEERHGAWDSIFHFLPAGVALAALATLPIGWLAERRPRAWLAPVAIAIVLFLDARGLRFYFQRGRPDWRPVAAYLRDRPADEPILAAGPYTQICVGYYVNGPDWLCCAAPTARPILDVGNDGSGLTAERARWSTAWLVTPVGSPVAEPPLPGATTALFPTADGGVRVRRLGGR